MTTIYLVKGNRFNDDWNADYDWIEKAFFMKEEADEHQVELERVRDERKVLTNKLSEYQNEWNTNNPGPNYGQLDTRKCPQCPHGAKKGTPAHTEWKKVVDEIREHNRIATEAHQARCDEHHARERAARLEFVTNNVPEEYREWAMEKVYYWSGDETTYTVEPLDVE